MVSMRTRMSMYAMLACLLLFALFPSTASAADSPELTAASVTGEGHVELTFSKAMAAPPEGAAGFAVFGFGSIPVLSSVLDPGDNTKILLTIADPISGGESAYLDYTPGTVKSADGEMLAAINNFSISNDLPHPTIDTTALPEGEVGTPYFYSFTTTGGTPPYTYSIYYGALPPGLVLQKSTGILSGTPTTDGTFGDSPLIRISVRDANNALGIRNITIVISESSGTEYPTVTGEATDVSWTSAQLSGSVAYSNGGSITERGFVYDTDDGPTTVSGTKIVCGAGAGDFSASVTGLQPSKRYCVRAYAIYGGGTVCYSNQIVVNTKSGTLPHVSTIPVNDTALTGATLRGNVTYDGGTEVTERGFVYGR